MEYIKTTDNIELSKNGYEDDLEFTLTLYDKYGHYDTEVKLTKIQAFDILEGLKGEEDEFINLREQ